MGNKSEIMRRIESIESLLGDKWETSIKLCGWNIESM